MVEKKKALLIYVLPELAHQFKLKCVKQKESMSNVVAKFIAKFVQD